MNKIYTPEQKTQEKDDKIYLTNYTPDYNQTAVDQADLTLDDLLTPAYERDYNTAINEKENSVYNPDSKLGSSVFQQFPSSDYSDYQQRQAENRDQEKTEKIYITIAVISIIYLFTLMN